ncbi:unnamed protein product [Effrenium voratum]|uniref:Uncharacterized protein n=1 Tax=Effrenium voratum TaxID=2562239 RepID=A0AA36HIZ0_9DINO|nr:unnamed protein product [Effrenium voratum]
MVEIYMMFFPAPRIAIGLSAAVSLIALQVTAANAFDPTGNEVADAFLSVLDAQEGTVESYGSVSESGNAVTIQQLVIKDENDKDTSVTIASTVLTGGEFLDNGRLKLESLGLEKLDLNADDGGMSLETMSVTGLVLPSAKESAANASPVSPGYKTFDVKNIQVRDEDGKIADIQAISSSIDSMDGDLPTAGSFSLSGATIDVNELEVEEAKSLKDLGYETLTLDVSASGRWDPEAAIINIPELKIDAKDAASLSLALSLGGVTREVVEQLEEKSEKPEEAMALLQNVTVINAKIRLDDETLTGRILDQEAQKAGVEVPVYVAGLTGSLPLILGMLQNKELEGQVAQAVTEFLTTPGSLQVVAAPATPVPFSQVMGTAMLAPQMIPQILSVGITANQ